MSALRKALGERKGEHRFVVTQPGRGYRFVAGVDDVQARAEADALPPTPAELPIDRPRTRVARWLGRVGWVPLRIAPRGHRCLLAW